MTETTIDAETEHLQELLQDFHTAMLVTRATTGELRARPMAVAEATEDGGLYFATSLDSPKIQELALDPQVNVCLQKGERYVSLSGIARVVTDRGLIDSLWSEAWKVWFPEGKSDPRLCLIAIEASEGEYWDRGGVKSLKYLFQAAKAYVTGTQPPAGDAQEHGKVSR